MREGRRYVLRGTRRTPDLSRYDADLNPAQLQAVTAGDGPHLVIAGAGSGKTRAITYRVAYLLDRGVDPGRILLVTFTNKAAREMLRRVEGLAEAEVRRVWGGTFHHVGNLVLRRHGEVLGLRRDYTILDREDTRELLEACVADLKINVKARRFPRSDVLQDLISFSVNTRAPLGQLLESRLPHFQSWEEEIHRVAARYRARKRQAHLVDYDDLLELWWQLLAEHEETRGLYARRFLHILCDEYQDTNRLQGEILDLLAGEHRNIMVVGDDSQSIFAFRGAHYANILRFRDRYPDARVHLLETNYRSTLEILALANASIAKNVHQYPKELRAVRPSGPRPAVVALADETEQAAFVAQRVLELRDEGIPVAEMAVLYRSHYLSLELQMELTRRGIPFEVRSGLRFFEQAHIKDVVSYLRIMANPRDELAWKRALKLHPGIGNAIADRIWRAVEAAADPLVAACSPEMAAGLPGRARSGLREFAGVLDRLADPGLRKAPGQMIQTILETGYEDELQVRYPNWRARLEDLRQLGIFALRYGSLEAFLSELALLGAIAGEDIVEDDARDELLVLSTVHQAKGLEWQVVFLIWLAEGRMPSSIALGDPEAGEEERRLFYVATTRAKDQLYLCYPQLARSLSGQDVLVRPSPFIQELPEGLYERWEVGPPSEDEAEPVWTP